MHQNSAQRQAHIFKALMHPVRLQILDLLRDGKLCVCQIEAQSGQLQAYVSQQLAVLRRVGLIKVVADRGLEAEVEKSTDYGQMMRWNLVQPPGLVVNDEAFSGKFVVSRYAARKERGYVQFSGGCFA